MPDEKRWPQATNYEEAGRLRLAYTTALEQLGDQPHSQSNERAWRTAVYRQRNAEALLALAQMHATLAVADELRAARESAREIGMAGLSPGARRDLLP